MRILGVDPGLTRCGLGVVSLTGARTVSLVDVSVARTSPHAEPGERIAAIATAVEDALDAHAIDAVAIERVFAQHNVRTVMGTAQVSGVVLLAAARRSLTVATYTPSEVKAAVSGHGRADKAQVAYMVAKILGLAEAPKPADAADALAIAITHAWRGGAAPTPSTSAQQAWLRAERAARRRG